MRAMVQSPHNKKSRHGRPGLCGWENMYSYNAVDRSMIVRGRVLINAQMIALQRGGDASRTKTQSPSPDLLAPEGINCLLPSLANGDPFTSAYSPLVGSYQR